MWFRLIIVSILFNWSENWKSLSQIRFYIVADQADKLKCATHNTEKLGNWRKFWHWVVFVRRLMPCWVEGEGEGKKGEEFVSSFDGGPPRIPLNGTSEWRGILCSFTFLPLVTPSSVFITVQKRSEMGLWLGKKIGRVYRNLTGDGSEELALGGNGQENRHPHILNWKHPIRFYQSSNGCFEWYRFEWGKEVLYHLARHRRNMYINKCDTGDDGV